MCSYVRRCDFRGRNSPTLPPQTSNQPSTFIGCQPRTPKHHTTHTTLPTTPHHTIYCTVNCGLNARIQGHQQPTSQQAMPTSKGIRITKNAQCSMLIHSFSQRTPHNQQPPRRWMTSSRLPTEQTSPPKAKSQNIATLVATLQCRVFASLSFIVVVVVTSVRPSVRPFIRLPHHHPYTSRCPVADLKRRGDRQSGVLSRLWRGMRRVEDSQPVVIRQCDDVGVPTSTLPLLSCESRYNYSFETL